MRSERPAVQTAGEPSEQMLLRVGITAGPQGHGRQHSPLKFSSPGFKHQTLERKRAQSFSVFQGAGANRCVCKSCRKIDAGNMLSDRYLQSLQRPVQRRDLRLSSSRRDSWLSLLSVSVGWTLVPCS